MIFKPVSHVLNSDVGIRMQIKVRPGAANNAILA